MTNVSPEAPKQDEKPGVKHHRARRVYAPFRSSIREGYRGDGENPNEHRRKIRREIRRLIEQKKHYENDGLTGLHTRTAFDEILIEELETGKKFKTQSTLIILDANGLKVLNDSEGHEAGDRLLKKIAEQLKAASRDTDLISRYGGDEFAVLLTDTDLENSVTWWERVNKGFVENGISISAGSREIFPREIGITSIDEFKKAADGQMYLAKALHKERGKEHGKNYYIGVGPDG